MKIKTKGLAQKIIVTIILIVLLFNVILPTTSHAEFDWGGTLWDPIQSLVCGLGDVVFNFLQASFIADAPEAVYKATLEQIETGKKPILNPIKDALDAFLDTVTGKTDSFMESWDYQRKKIPFPSIYYSVENIFANKIPAFDVNFINPSINMPTVDDNSKSVKELEKEASFLSKNTKKSDTSFKEIENIVLSKMQQIYESSEYQLYDGKPYEENEIIKIDESKKSVLDGNFDKLNEKEKWVRKNYIYWFEGYSEIPWGEINKEANDAGINLDFNTHSEAEDSSDDESGISLKIDATDNIAKSIRGTISSWYKALRNLAIVAMLSILVYIAIRIIIASASEEAKYKIMLKDWFVAICLLFVMHYIMSFSLNVTQNITNMLSNSYQEALESYGNFENTGSDQISSQTLSTSIRYGVSLSEDVGDRMGYTILYALLVIYTIIFTWQYLKRVIYMAFLTTIAPLVAMTYPIDKINDGKAQGFNMWLKEYIFNLLLQPLHMLLFMILAVSAMDLFTTSVIYSLVVLGFLLQAIKILKKLFGFDSKAPIGGGGLASGFAGGAIFSSLLNTVKKVPSIGERKNSRSSGDSRGIRMANNFELPPTNNVGVSGNLSTFSGGSGSNTGSNTKNANRASDGPNTRSTKKTDDEIHNVHNKDGYNMYARKPDETDGETRDKGSYNMYTRKPDETDGETRNKGSYNMYTRKPDEADDETRDRGSYNMYTRKPDEIDDETHDKSGYNMYTRKPDEIDDETHDKGGYDMYTRKPDETDDKTRNNGNYNMYIRKPDEVDGDEVHNKDGYNMYARKPDETDDETHDKGSYNMYIRKPDETGERTNVETNERKKKRTTQKIDINFGSSPKPNTRISVKFSAKTEIIFIKTKKKNFKRSWQCSKKICTSSW